MTASGSPGERFHCAANGVRQRVQIGGLPSRRANGYARGAERARPG
jgi:hypothetical protein